jgi:hypothetical protein
MLWAMDRQMTGGSAETFAMKHFTIDGSAKS